VSDPVPPRDGAEGADDLVDAKPAARPKDDADAARPDAPPGATTAATGGPSAAARGGGDGRDARGNPSQVGRLLFYFAWFLVVPALFAQLRVLLLAALPEVPIVETLRGQPIPVSILLFTIAGMLLYNHRWSLPGASAVGIGGRPGLAASVRKRFDQARALIDEVRAIRRAHAKDIERQLREEQRDEIDRTMVELETSMNAASFDEPRFEAAFDAAANVVDDRLGHFRKGELREYLESILVAIMVALAIRAFVIEAFKIPSGSMIPTLMVGDHIFVNKLAYGPLIPFSKKRVWESMPPKRGDVMVFAFPEKPEEDFIKRVIALPGDKLEVKDGRVWVNDAPIPRCYVGRTRYKDVPENESVPELGTYEGELYVEFLGGQSYLTFYATTRYGSMKDGTAETSPVYARTNAGPWFPKPGEVWVLGDNRNNSRDSREWFDQKGGGVPFENIKGRALWIWLSYTRQEGSKPERIGSSVMGRPRLPAEMHDFAPQLERCLGANPPLDPSGVPVGK
jgi:signal peptidase I